MYHPLKGSKPNLYETCFDMQLKGNGYDELLMQLADWIYHPCHFLFSNQLPLYKSHAITIDSILYGDYID